MLESCALCPRRCKVNRLAGGRGECGAGAGAVVASAGPHFGEEPCLVGVGGSGTIFLAGCNLHCAFCQNDDISRQAVGEEMETAALVRLMRGLERRGCVNINLVTPTHMMPALAAAIVEARADGLAVPIVWNCGGYEAVEALHLLDGLVEIYMPDFKFINPASAECYCRAPDYPDRAKEALREMHRQVGDLVVEDGVAARGLLVRHLVMPGGTEEGRQIVDFLASLSPRTYVNVMGQYRPAAAVVHPRTRGQYRAIDRRPTAREVYEVRDYAVHLGLRLAD